VARSLHERCLAMTPRAFLALVAVVLCAGCGPSRAARTSLQEGERAMAAFAFRPALTHFRTAVADALDYAAAQLARGQAAEALGEFDEALEAYRTAAGLAAAIASRWRRSPSAWDSTRSPWTRSRAPRRRGAGTR